MKGGAKCTKISCCEVTTVVEIYIEGYLPKFADFDPPNLRLVPRWGCTVLCLIKETAK